MFFLFPIFVLVSPVNAESRSCERMTSHVDFYECTLQRHPKVAIAEERTREAEAIYDKATQWQNPDMAVKSIGGNQAGESLGTTEVALLIPLSQVWTRGAQKSVASAEKRMLEVEAKQTLVDIKKTLILDLYRLRQIEDDLELVNETLGAFETIEKQLGSRKARGPDQEITLNLVQLAASDYQLKRNHIQIEKAELHSHLKALWGKDFEIKRSLLPSLREKWPEVIVASGIYQNLAVQKAVAETERTSAEYRLARLQSLPALSAGPVMERSTTGQSRNWAYGFGLEVGIPIFSWNGGAREVARSRSIQAELESTFALRKFDFEKDIQLLKYRSAVESLGRTSSREDLKKKHNKIDSYFRQGLASGGLVIEAHRQAYEYLQSQHEHENSAIEAYVDFMTMTGGAMEGIL